MEIRASSATSFKVRSCPSRSRRRTSPTSCRHSGSLTASPAGGTGRSGTTRASFDALLLTPSA
jgi:hypothetical protein